MPRVNFKMAECRALNLVKKPNTKSSVWTYFGLEADESDKPLRDKEDSPVCRACKKSVLAKGGNTSNLLTHLYDHPIQFTSSKTPATFAGSCQKGEKA